MSAQPTDSHHILDWIPHKQRGEITFIQHNTARRPEAHQTVLELAAQRKADILAIQEPCAWKDKATQKFYTISHNMYELILPTNSLIRPRVTIYIRKALNLQFKIRQDLAENADFLPVEFCSPMERFLLFNIYNEKELNHDSTTQPTGTSTIQRSVLHLHPNLPFLILGDFNSHHVWWNRHRGTSTTETTHLVEWLQRHNCQLLNQEESTFFHSNLTTPSIIDLAFYSSNFKETQFDNWSVIEDTGSDHVTIAFSLFTGDTERFLNPLLSRFNFKRADWECFEEGLHQAVEREQVWKTLKELEGIVASSSPLSSLPLPSWTFNHPVADSLATKFTNCL